MKKKIIGILAVIIIFTTIILISSRGYEDFPIDLKPEKYTTTHYKSVTKEEILNDFFEDGSEEIKISNADIQKGLDNTKREKVIKFIFKDGGYMSLPLSSRAPGDINKIVLFDSSIMKLKGDNNEIVFDKLGNILEAKITLKEEKEFFIDGWLVHVPKDGKLDFDGESFTIKVPDGGIVKKPSIISEKGNPSETFRFMSLEEDGSFKIDVKNFKSRKFEDGLEIKGEVYYGKKEFKTVKKDSTTEEYKTAERINFYVKDDVIIEGMEVKFNVKNPEDVLVLGFDEKVLSEAPIINENYLVFSEYVMEGEETSEGGNAIYGYKLDVDKKKNKPLIAINFNKKNPIFTGNEDISMVFGKGESEEGFSEISIVERGTENLLFETKGWNSFNFNGDNVYTKYNNKNGETNIYRKVKGNIPKESENYFTIRAYKQNKEIVLNEPVFDSTKGRYEVLRFSDEYQVIPNVKSYRKSTRVKLINPKSVDIDERKGIIFYEEYIPEPPR